MERPVQQHRSIAYFTMEIGLSHTIPTYSGGLGVLAGDTIKSFSDLGVPLVCMTLLNEKGYFSQQIDHDGNQYEENSEWDLYQHLTKTDKEISVIIEGRTVYLSIWKYEVQGISGHCIPIYFLDSNNEKNSDFDKTLTSHLYGGDRYYRLCQEIILGIGGFHALQVLGHNKIEKYHMNEGHAALLGAELLEETIRQSGVDQHIALKEVQKHCVFTTHTPVAAGHDRFEKELFDRVVGDTVPTLLKEKMFDGEKYNMTYLALNCSQHTNGVAKRHGEVSREMFPGFSIGSITNGIHSKTWASKYMTDVFDHHIPDWAIDPFSLRSGLNIPTDHVVNAHAQAKKELIERVNHETGASFHPARFTIGYARRFTAYKRPLLILQDIERLKKIAEKVGDIQIIFAGKAHPHDHQGKELIKSVVELSRKLDYEQSKVRIVFLKGYNMELARQLVSGCDVWLNTPQRPREASGTSGMKAALNGVPQISTLDGWWIEGHIEGITGWSIGPHPNDPGFLDDSSPDDEATDLYSKLENDIVPLYYGEPEKWHIIMKKCIGFNASFFHTHRMAEQYISTVYFG